MRKSSYNDDDYESSPESEPISIHLFDVTAVIGSVYSGGNENPRLVAFRMIAEHTENLEGECRFTFPNLDGSLNTVTVDRKVP
jgi:hypothetical protein